MSPSLIDLPPHRIAARVTDRGLPTTATSTSVSPRDATDNLIICCRPYGSRGCVADRRCHLVRVVLYKCADWCRSPHKTKEVIPSSTSGLITATLIAALRRNCNDGDTMSRNERVIGDTGRWCTGDGSADGVDGRQGNGSTVELRRHEGR